MGIYLRIRQIARTVRSLILARYTLSAYVLASIVGVVSIYLLYSLIKELVTPNFGYHGTHYDFIAFYAIAQTVLHHHTQSLYSASQLTPLQRQIVPHAIGASGYMPYLNPPFLAVLLAPLALLHITAARLVWSGINLVCACFVVFQFTRPLKSWQRLTAGLLLLSTFPMYQALVEGQISAIVLLGGCLAYLGIKHGHEYWGEAALVLLWILPQFGVFALIGLVLRQKWKLLVGWCVSSAVLIFGTLPFTGLKLYTHYVQVLASVTGDHFTNMSTSTLLTWRGALETTMGLNGFYSSIIGQSHTLATNLLYGVSVASLIALLVWAWLGIRRQPSGKPALYLYIAAILSALLIDPHLFAQDIVMVYMIIPALCLLYKRYIFGIIVCVAGLCDVVLIDQYHAVHIFTVVLSILAITFAYRAGSMGRLRPSADHLDRD